MHGVYGAPGDGKTSCEPSMTAASDSSCCRALWEGWGREKNNPEKGCHKMSPQNKHREKGPRKGEAELQKNTPEYRLGAGKNSKGCGNVCRDPLEGWKRVGQHPPGCPTPGRVLPPRQCWFEDSSVTSGLGSPGTGRTGMSCQSRAVRRGAAPSSTLQQSSRIHLLRRP